MLTVAAAKAATDWGFRVLRWRHYGDFEREMFIQVPVYLPLLKIPP